MPIPWHFLIWSVQEKTLKFEIVQIVCNTTKSNENKGLKNAILFDYYRLMIFDWHLYKCPPDIATYMWK